MENSTFWSKFLLFDAILLVLTGLDFVISSFLFPEAIKIVYNLYWGNELSISVNQFNYLKLLFSVTGAIMVGFGITISTLAYYLIKNGDQQFVWTSVTFGLLDWFVLDSLASVLVEAYVNLFLNLIFLVLFLIPILGRKFLNESNITSRITSIG